MKTKRELQFLTYLDALERGDAEAVSAFLALAEADAELEKMMLDHHSDEKTEEKPKVITPFKRKREDANRWLQRFGNGLVAAIVLLLVGISGLIIGSTGGADKEELSEMMDSAADPNALTTPQDPAAWLDLCTVEIASPENQVMLLADGDITESMIVGVNNPFVVVLNNSRENIGGGYSGIFEGLRVTIARNSLNVSGDCEGIRNVTVYPKDNPDRTCSIEVEVVMNLPLQQYTPSMLNQGFIPYDKPFVRFDEPVDGVYPLLDLRFEGGISGRWMNFSGECTSYPLLYVVPYEANQMLVGPNDFGTVVDIDSLRVTEQFFERGAMFYLEAAQAVWTACDDEYGRWYSWITVPSQAGDDFLLPSDGIPSEGLFAPQTVFVDPWRFLTMHDEGEQPLCDLGWATSDPLLVERAAYHYYNGVHSITSSTGETYTFFQSETGNRGYLWRIDEE